MKKFTIITICLIVFSYIFGITYQEYNPNDDRFRILALQKAKKRLEQSEQEYNRAQRLFEKKFISEDEFQNIRLQYENDKLNFQQYMLGVIFENPYITVVKAEKYKDETGQYRVVLQIKNNSAGSYALEDELISTFKEMKLRPESLYNVYVSLKDEQGNIISQPYEYHIPEMISGKSYTIDFSVLRDIQAVTVSAVYAGKVDEKRVWLKRKTAEQSVVITSNVFSQEVETAASALYNLKIEYFGDYREVYKLNCSGLPKSYSYSFINSSNNAAISTLAMSAQVPIHNVALSISVPEKIDESAFNKALAFDVSILGAENKVQGANELQIIPVGKAEMELAMNNMFFIQEKGIDFDVTPISIRNTGKKVIKDITFEVLMPSGWEKTIEPEFIDKLEPEQEQKLKFTISPDKKSLQGIYQLRIKAKGKDISKSVFTSDKELKMEILNKSNIWVNIILIIAAIAILGLLIYFMVKLSRN